MRNNKSILKPQQGLQMKSTMFSLKELTRLH